MELRDHLQAAINPSLRIERELTGGGMSRVFLCMDKTLDRRIVVKLLHAETSGPLSLERFEREVAFAARLQHPHIVPLLSAGNAEGVPYYTMPFVAGESLRSRLAREGELPIAESIRILREVATALACAHATGIVHRDIKPDNILLSGGSALVTDFGVAKAISAATHGTAGLTSTGIALGTPGYMAPEQAGADPLVDQRADIYAWGVVAYEMLTGSAPFAGRPVAALLAAHLTEHAANVSERRPSTPSALGALIMQCLEKRPADRPQHATELVTALDQLLTPGGGTRAASRPLSRRIPGSRGVVATIGTAVVVLAAVAWILRARAERIDSRTMARGRSADPEALQLFAKGEVFRRRLDALPAIVNLKLAIQRDPQFARGYASLAAAYATLPLVSFDSPDSALALAGEALGRAVALDSTLAAVHVARALMRMVSLRMSEAELGLRKALVLEPNNAEAYFWLAQILAWLGREDEGLVAAREALRIEPTSDYVPGLIAYIQYAGGHFDDAIVANRKALQADPTSVITFENQAVAFAFAGQLDSAVAASRQALRLGASNYGGRGWLMFAFAAAGRWREATEQRDALIGEGGNSPNFNRAFAHIVFGAPDSALATLEKAFQAREPLVAMTFLSCDPMWDPLRANPRFIALLQSHGARSCAPLERWPVRPR